MASTTNPRKKLTDLQSTFAFIVGGGIALIILTLGLASMQGERNGTLDLTLLIGILLLVGGAIGWGFATRPWKDFDDWSTPLFTGHDHAPHAVSHSATSDTAHNDQEHVASIMAPEAEPAHGEVSGHAHGTVVDSAVVAESAPVLVVAEAPAETQAASADAGDQIIEEPAAVTPVIGSSDDLTKLEGIGPKIAGALNAAGVTTFAELAKRPASDLEQIVRSAGVRMVGHGETWAEQAKLAAEGNWTALETLQKQLNAGQRR